MTIYDNKTIKRNNVSTSYTEVLGEGEGTFMGLYRLKETSSKEVPFSGIAVAAYPVGYQVGCEAWHWLKESGLQRT